MEPKKCSDCGRMFAGSMTDCPFCGKKGQGTAAVDPRAGLVFCDKCKLPYKSADHPGGCPVCKRSPNIAAAQAKQTRVEEEKARKLKLATTSTPTENAIGVVAVVVLLICIALPMIGMTNYTILDMGALPWLCAAVALLPALLLTRAFLRNYGEKTQAQFEVYQNWYPILGGVIGTSAAVQGGALGGMLGAMLGVGLGLTMRTKIGLWIVVALMTELPITGALFGAVLILNASSVGESSTIECGSMGEGKQFARGTRFEYACQLPDGSVVGDSLFVENGTASTPPEEPYTIEVRQGALGFWVKPSHPEGE